MVDNKCYGTFKMSYLFVFFKTNLTVVLYSLTHHVHFVHIADLQLANKTKRIPCSSMTMNQCIITLKMENANLGMCSEHACDSQQVPGRGITLTWPTRE